MGVLQTSGDIFDTGTMDKDNTGQHAFVQHKSSRSVNTSHVHYKCFESKKVQNLWHSMA